MMNAARKIQIDFSTPSPQLKIGFVIFLLAIVSAVWSVQQYYQLNSIREAELARAASLERQLHENKPVIPPSIQHALNAEWNGLLSALERANAENVKLISLESNRQEKSITITADTTNLESMIAYFQTLTAQPILSNVKLSEHSMQHEEENKYIRFVITANWGGQS